MQMRKRGMDVNKKAEKFKESLNGELENIFKPEELQDEYKTVIYRSNMEVKEKYITMKLIFDTTIYSVFRVWVATNVINDENRSRVEAFINEMNRQYKVFKYYTSEKGDLVLDCCIPSTDEAMDPALVRAVIDVVLQHLQEKYTDIMQVIWGAAQQETPEQK